MNKYKESDYGNLQDENGWLFKEYWEKGIKIKEIKNSLCVYDDMMEILEMYHQTINDVVSVYVSYDKEKLHSPEGVHHIYTNCQMFKYSNKKDTVEALDFLKLLKYNEVWIKDVLFFTKSGKFFVEHSGWRAEQYSWFDATNALLNNIAMRTLHRKSINACWYQLDLKYFFNERGFEYPVVMNAYEELEKTFQDWYNLSIDDIAVFYLEYDGKFIGDLEELKNITVDRKIEKTQLYGYIIAKDGTEYIRTMQRKPVFDKNMIRKPEYVIGYEWVAVWCKLDEEERREGWVNEEEFPYYDWRDTLGRIYIMETDQEELGELYEWELYPLYFCSGKDWGWGY